MKQEKSVGIVVARMGSTRVPGKSVTMVSGKPLLYWVLKAAREIRGLDQVVLATTSLEQDAPLVAIAEESGVPVYRGDPEKVLDRVWGACVQTGARVVMEIGGDCPFIDPDIFADALEFFRAGDWDYVNNYDPPTFPEGMDINILKVSAIERAFREAVVPSQRIHPFSYLTRHPHLFRIANYAFERDLSRYHWSLDFPEDCEFIVAVYERLVTGERHAIRMREVLNAIERDTELRRLNEALMKPQTLHAFWNSPGIIKDMHADIAQMIAAADERQREGKWAEAAALYDEMQPILGELGRIAQYKQDRDQDEVRRPALIEHFEIHRENDRYISFPHVVFNGKGRILLSFRKAGKFSADAAKRGVATHHDRDSSIELVTSGDNGRTWSRESTTIYKSGYGVNDPAMTLLRDGSILVRFVALRVIESCRGAEITGKLFSHRAEHGLVCEVVGNMVMRSCDGGATWKEVGVATVRGSEELTRSCSRDPIVELADGSWVMPVYTGAPQRSDIAWVIRSFDQGATWQEPTVIMVDREGEYSQLHGTNYNETSLLSLGGGELLALTRGDTTFHTTANEFMPVGGAGELYSARSLDGGLCWTPSARTGIWGQPGSLLQLKDGKLLATYGYRKKPFGVRCCLSADRGRTWLVDREIVVRDDGVSWDLGYPNSLQLPDESILTVYYMSDVEGNRFIAGSIWRLP